MLPTPPVVLPTPPVIRPPHRDRDEFGRGHREDDDRYEAARKQAAGAKATGVKKRSERDDD